MRLAYFIAQRLQRGEHYKHSVSARIIKIATIAVALGMSMILIALATGFGLQQEIAAKTALFNGHLTISSFENNQSSISLQPVGLTPEMQEFIQSQPQVVQLSGVTYKAALFKSQTTFEGGMVKGVGPAYRWEMLSDYLQEGRFPDFTGEKQREILISATLAARLNVGVGDRIQFFFQKNTTQKIPLRRTVEIVGMYQSGFPEFDESLVFASLDLVHSVTQWPTGQVGSYEVVLADYKILENVANQIYDRLPSALDVNAITDRYANIFQWIALFDYNILIILVIMIIVGVINMATALLVMILERKRMIRLLQILGSEAGLIQAIFLWNGARILIHGLFWGNVVGLLFFFSQHYGEWIRLDPATYFVAVAPVSLSVTQLVFLNAFVLVVSLFFLWFPLRIVLGQRKGFQLRHH